MHRRNAEHALIFHRRELPTSLAEMIAVSDRFVADVEANTEAPLPFRHHPMWSRAIDHHVTTAFQVQDLSRLAVITGDTSLAKRQSLTGGVRKIMLGRAPNFRPWHPQWPDVRMLKRNLLDAKGDVALVSDTSAGVRHWLDTIAMERGGRSVVHIQSRDILCISGIAAEPPSARFDRVFLVLEKVPDGLADVLARLVSLMKPGGVLVLCFGQIFSEIEVDSESTFALMPEHAVFRTSGLSLKRVDCVGRGRWRTAVQTAMMRHARHSVRRGNLGAFYGITVAGGLAAISMFLNMISLRSYRSGQSRFSSLVYTLNLTGS